MTASFRSEFSSFVKRDPMAQHPDICVIANIKSGKQDDVDREKRIRSAFEQRGVEIEFKAIQDGRNLAREARRTVDQGYSTIVAAGGDGTICAVASALRNTDCTMGIIPLGTFNYFARSLEIPADIEVAIDIITDGATRSERVATINDAVFLNNASLGAYPAILRNREDIYRRWGRSRAAAYWSVLVTLVTLRRPLRLKITIGDKNHTVRTPLAFVVNNAFQLEEIGLTGTDHIENGDLALYLAPDDGRWGMLRHAIALALGRAEQHENFEVLAGSDIQIEMGKSSRHVARDGERERMTGPLKIKVLQDALTLLVPSSQTTGIR
jgi:YegS/Rv2252/BmrU family lipid kinase